MSGGDKYFIPEEEAKKIAGTELKGLTFVPSIKGFINLSFVQSVIPEDRIDRSKQSSGVLHDGTRVIKKFGNWVDARNPEVNLNIEYYPEIIKDEVMTEDEYENKQKLLS
jgi:hypothetical protein